VALQLQVSSYVKNGVSLMLISVAAGFGCQPAQPVASLMLSLPVETGVFRPPQGYPQQLMMLQGASQQLQISDEPFQN